MIVAQRYEIGQALGAGGEARVFQALDQSSGAQVAIRLAPAPNDQPQPEPAEFSPHWVRQVDHGVDLLHGPYAIYELLEGETLAALIGRGPLPADEWHHFVCQSLEAVSALHQAGWTHGDLNSANFFLHRGATWKLLELPFYRGAPSARSPLFGSIYTLAPEQIDGHAPDFRSDMYALGCLYYYAASGRYPHDGGSEADIAIGRLRFPPALLSESAPNFPETRAAWIMRLLERDPDQRPASLEAALHTLSA